MFSWWKSLPKALTSTCLHLLLYFQLSLASLHLICPYYLAALKQKRQNPLITSSGKYVLRHLAKELRHKMIPATK